MIQLEEAKSGLVTMKYDNKYIHSKYDPMKEAEQFAQGNANLIEQDYIVVYGIGLGYHIEKIALKMKRDSILYVFEYNEELITYCKKINNKIFHYDNVKIIGPDNKKFYKKLAECLDIAGDIIIHKPSLDTIMVKNEKLFNLINDFTLVKQSNKYRDEMMELGDENYKQNMKQSHKHIRDFICKFNNNKPWVVVSAGPSIDDDIQLLKENSHKYNIICVGSALRVLITNGIKPQGIVIIDAKEIVKKQLEGYENEDIPLCFLSTASKWAIESYNGPKYMFNISDDDDMYIKTDGTVAVPAINIAILSGAKEVILLGQDLAFAKDKSHSETFEKIYGFKDDYKNYTKVKSIKGIDGQYLDTTRSYLFYKNKIELLINKNEHIKFINCSKGAIIDGAKHMSLYDFIHAV